MSDSKNGYTFASVYRSKCVTVFLNQTIDCCTSLRPNKFFLVVLGVVDMRQLLLKPSYVPYSPNQFLGWNFFCHFLQQDGSRQI